MIDRREFLSGTLGISVAFSLGAAPACAQGSSQLGPMLRRNPALDSWLRISADGGIDLLTGRAELGQGILTALAQIVAEELNVAVEDVKVATVDTDLSPNEGYTFGSVSIELGGAAARQAAAFMHEVLLEKASDYLDLQRASLQLVGNAVHAPTGQSVAIAELAENLSADLVVGAATQKTREPYRQVGRSVERVDIPPKVFADSVYIQDLRLPGMVHARVVKPPLHSARITSLELAGLTEDIDLVRDGSFLAVLCDKEYRAVLAAGDVASKVRWSQPATQGASTPDEFLDEAEGVPAVVYQEGEKAAASGRVFQALYRRPFLAHAALSPSMALARYADDLLTVWCHGQGMFPLRGAIAEVVGLPEGRVRCIHVQSSGVYGHNGADDAACDAAILAVARPGRTIRLQYSRQDEFRIEPLGSAMEVKLSASASSEGKLVSWEAEITSGPHSTRPSGRAGAPFLSSAGLLKRPLPGRVPMPLSLPRGGADRNALPYYDCGSVEIRKRFVAEPPVRVSALRSLGAFANVLAIESFMDEIAMELGVDSIDFRLRHLTDPRARAVITRLRDRCDQQWGRAQPAYGIGFGRYKNSSAYCAIGARVSIDERRRKILVTDMIAVVDAGLIVNPDGARNQIEGGMIQSASWTLKEQVTFKGHQRASLDWSGYPILRFDEVPLVDVEFVKPMSGSSLGTGEAAQGPAAAAIANALAMETGVRLRSLPLRFEDWQAAVRT